jgi:hypothetical protein
MLDGGRITNNLNFNDMKNEYITPTVECPVFVAQNSYSGYVITSIYKRWESINERYEVCGDTTALNLTDAIVAVHNHIRECGEYINKGAKFEVYMIDGTCNGQGEPIRVKCYSVTMREAKKYRII